VAAAPEGVAAAQAEIDPWEDPLLPVQPVVGNGEGIASAPPPSAPAAVAARAPDVDLLAGDDGLGEGTDTTLAKATLAGFGEKPDAPDQSAISDLQTIDTRVVRIAVEGATAPVAVDGRKVGTAPVALDLEPGSHAVTLYADEGKATTFELEATADLADWCFEAKGRTFGQVRCD
jgi:hypothetical protein